MTDPSTPMRLLRRKIVQGRPDFDDVDEFEERGWWITRAPGNHHRTVWYSALHEDHELARVEVIVDIDLNGYVAPQIEVNGRSVVQSIEVGRSVRGNDLGRDVLKLVAQAHNDHIASFPRESSLGYWVHTGWRGVEHALEPHRPALYLPPRWRF